TVAIWDAKTGVLIRQLKVHTSVVTSVAFSPDGTQIASGSHDQTVAIWDAKTGVLIGQLKGHTAWVISVAFSPDGLCLISKTHFETKFWDIGSPNGHPIDSNSVKDNIVLSTTTIQSGIQQSPGYQGSRPSIYREGRWIMSNVHPKHLCFLMQTEDVADSSFGNIFAFGTRSGDFYILDFSNLFPAA
ncbi:hypothetical protein FRC02_003997, partial [Tulasnella sp. 418]